MAKVKVASSSSEQRKRRPAIDPEAREKQMISYAVDLAEQQLLDGTASAQVITHYLKLGSTKERIEKELLQKKSELMTAQADAIRAAKRTGELIDEALTAMRKYSGYGDSNEG